MDYIPWDYTSKDPLMNTNTDLALIPVNHEIHPARMYWKEDGKAVPILPQFEVPEGHTDYTYLEELTWSGNGKKGFLV